MAQTATKDAVQATMKPPEYRKAYKRLQSIPGLKKKAAESAKKVGDVHSACETMNGVHQTATKFFAGIMQSDEAEQLRIFRDINGLLNAAGIATSGADLVDKASGEVVHMRFGDGQEPDTVEGEGDDGIADEVGNLEDDAGDDGPASEPAESGADEVGGGDDGADDVPSGADDGADSFEEASEAELAAQTTRQEVQEARDGGDGEDQQADDGENQSSGGSPSLGEMQAAEEDAKTADLMGS